MAVHASLAASPASNRRISPRRTLRLDSTITDGDEDVVIHDMSHTGLLLETTALLPERQTLDVVLPEVGLVRATVVWRSGRYVGCRFVKPVSQAAVSAALLRNPIALPEGLSGERAWEQLGKLLAADELEQGPSFATKLRVILAASAVLWAIILWAVGII